jgi:sugar (pentulose or hexulose) kinase
MITVVGLDVGSSFIKAAVFDIADRSSIRSIWEQRAPHDTRLILNDPNTYVTRVERDVRSLLREAVRLFSPAKIGMSSYRESVVAFDSLGRVVKCGSNRHLEVSRRGILQATSTSRIVVVSIASWLAWRLTGTLTCTDSDVHAIRRFQGMSLVEAPWPMPDASPVGSSLGWAHGLGVDTNATVFLGGTDEQVAHLGAGLGEDCDLAINTGTFWTFAWVSETSMSEASVRVIPRIPPFPPSHSVIGFRWGDLLQDWNQAHRSCDEMVPPDWCFGGATRSWANGASRADVLAAIKEDVRRIPEVIGEELAPMRRATICGSGMQYLPYSHALFREVFGHLELRYMPQDATLYGLAVLAQRSPWETIPSN